MTPSHQSTGTADTIGRMADQRGCIAMLRRNGAWDGRSGRNCLLRESVLALMVEHRNLILHELGRDT